MDLGWKEKHDLQGKNITFLKSKPLKWKLFREDMELLEYPGDLPQMTLTMMIQLFSVLIYNNQLEEVICWIWSHVNEQKHLLWNIYYWNYEWEWLEI